MRNPLRSSRSTFGIPIAKESVTDCNASKFHYGEYDPRHTDTSDCQEPLVIAKHSFCMGLGAHRRSDGGGLLPRAGETSDRLVADTRFFSRLPGAHFCCVPGMGEEKNPSRYENCSHLERNCFRCPGAGCTGPGGLRSRAVPLSSLAGDPAGRTSALLLPVATPQGASFRFAGPAPGDPDSLYHFQRDNRSA